MRHPDASSDISPLSMMRWGFLNSTTDFYESPYDFLWDEPDLYGPEDGEELTP